MLSTEIILHSQFMQMEYAALDAVVLIHIFRHVRNHCQTADAEGPNKIEGKSYIVSDDSETLSSKSFAEVFVFLCVCRYVQILLTF